MAHYRIYLLSLGGYFLDTDEFDAVDDNFAVVRMAGHQAPAKELWEGRRLVLKSSTSAKS